MPLYYSVVNSLDFLVSFSLSSFLSLHFLLSLDSISALLMLDEPFILSYVYMDECIYDVVLNENIYQKSTICRFVVW